MALFVRARARAGAGAAGRLGSTAATLISVVKINSTFEIYNLFSVSYIYMFTHLDFLPDDL
eukprot:SAG11_NODE_39360_length_234_cov_3.866667_1_plen_60_part_01